MNHIADLEVCPNQAHVKSRGADYSRDSLTYNRNEAAAEVFNGKKIKHCRLDDEWETFTVRFRVHIPEYHPGSEMHLTINEAMVIGSAEHRNRDGYRMQAAAQPYEWLMNKYGVPVRPWERKLKMRNDKNDSKGQFYVDDENTSLYYSYAFTNG